MPQTMLVSYLTLLAGAARCMPSPEIQIMSDAVPDVDGEPVDLLISFRTINGRNDQRLFGSFSAAGRNYETSGDVVQVFPYRACDIKRKGHDRTLIDHIAVVFFDELEPFIVGCVSLDNQVRFAEKSGALGLVVGPESRVVTQINKLQRGRIPVVILDDLEAKRFKKQLNEASQYGSVVKLSLHYVEPRPHYTLRLQVFRPTILNISLIILLLMLVLFITGLVLIKIKWKPTSHRDLWLRTLARSAVNKMEIRKFEKVGSRPTESKKSLRKERSFFCVPGKQKYLPVFGSLSSVTPSSTIQERCSICLEEYKEGQELRVLFCGHEFHPKCVDPWLLNNRRCPLCQYDVVYKEYPRTSTISKTICTSSLPRIEPPSSQESPLLASDTVNCCEINLPSYTRSENKPSRSQNKSLIIHAHRFMQQDSQKSRKYRSRDCRRRTKIVRSRSAGMQPKRRYIKQKRLVDAFPGSPMNNNTIVSGFSKALSGYSSDVSSYMEVEHVLVRKPIFTHSQAIPSCEIGRNSCLEATSASCQCQKTIPLDRISCEDLFSNFAYQKCKLPSCRMVPSI